MCRKICTDYLRETWKRGLGGGGAGVGRWVVGGGVAGRWWGRRAWVRIYRDVISAKRREDQKDGYVILNVHHLAVESIIYIPLKN